MKDPEYYELTDKTVLHTRLIKLFRRSSNQSHNAIKNASENAVDCLSRNLRAYIGEFSGSKQM